MFTLGDLLGQPVMFEEDDDLDDVPAIRDALMAPGRLSRVIGGDVESDGVVDVSSTGRLVEFGWSDYQRGRLGNVIAQLPSLIRQAQHLEDSAAQRGGPERRAAWTVSARAHHLAATTLSKVGEADLSWIAAERAMHAADRVRRRAGACFHRTGGCARPLAVGRFDDAVEMGNTAARWLADHLANPDPAALSLLGMLHLRTAIAAARRMDRATTTELLDKAETAATRVGADIDHWHTSFGPTNVAVHRLSAALRTSGTSPGSPNEGRTWTSRVFLPNAGSPTSPISPGRWPTWLRDPTKRLGLLLAAEHEAPALVRHSAAVREIVKEMQRRASVTGVARSSKLGGLAQRCRAAR